MAGDSAWKCPFPAEAGGIDEAFVQLRVFVSADGQALDAAVLADPGHGFGAAAVRCAIGTRWSPALDREGIAVRGTAIVRVRFTR
jgi:protein TonB